MRFTIVLLLALFSGGIAYGQGIKTPDIGVSKKVGVAEHLTMEDAIRLAEQRSTAAFVARHQFLAAYWQYRSFKAELLPSLNLGVTLPNFSHAMVPLQNSETGEYNYVQEFSMRNNVSLSIDQNIALTGGKVSVYSSLERLDQFEPNRYKRYNTNPVSITYTQPIFGSFNSLKWNKKIEPELYEQAKFEYLEAVEAIAEKAVNLFFTLAQTSRDLEMARTNYANSEKLYQIAQERFRIGTITQNDLMQLELRMLNDGLAINQNEVQVKLAGSGLASFLGYPANTNLEPVLSRDIPEVNLNQEEVYALSISNTSFMLDKKTRLLDAEMNVARAKANRGAKADFFTQFGLNQNADNFGGSYHRPQDQENIRLGIQLPIMDWGMGRGRVKTATSRMNVIMSQVEQEEIDHRQDIMIKVLQFNNQGRQCRISAKADTVAMQRYALSMEQFSNGKLSVLEFNTAQSEKDQATGRFILELHNFWKYYYALQRATLYDFSKQRSISTDFDLLLND